MQDNNHSNNFSNNLYETKEVIPMTLWYSSDNDVYYNKLLEIDDSSRKSGLSQNTCSQILRKLGCIHSFGLRQADVKCIVEPKDSSNKPKYRKKVTIEFTVTEEGFNLEYYLNSALNNKSQYTVTTYPSASIDSKRYSLCITNTNKADLVAIVTKFITNIYNDTAVSKNNISVNIDLPSDTADNIIYVSKPLMLQHKILNIYNIQNVEAYINVDSDNALDELEALCFFAANRHLEMLNNTTQQSYDRILKIHYIENKSDNVNLSVNPQEHTDIDNLDNLSSKTKFLLLTLLERVAICTGIDNETFYDLMTSTSDKVVLKRD